MQLKTGNIFQLGPHRLACGDASDSNLLKKLIEENRIRMVLTDPPYGVGYVEGKKNFNHLRKKKDIANDHTQSESEYKEFTRSWIESLKPYLAKKNTFYIFNSDKMIFALREAMQESEVKLAQLLIWVKNHSVVGRLNYCPQHELIAYGWYGSHTFHKSKDKSVIFYPKPNKSPLHPTMKPVGLLRHLILNNSKVGEIVFDPFAGSGSTLIACEQTKRICFCIEIDPEYCQVIIDRFEKVTGIKAKRIKP